MQIKSDIDVTVRVHYLDIEGLRFPTYRVAPQEVEWHSISASATMRDDGSLGHVFVTGAGRYVKNDGTVGLRDARLRFGGLRSLPEDWQERITRDLTTLLDRVTVTA